MNTDDATQHAPTTDDVEHFIDDVDEPRLAHAIEQLRSLLVEGEVLLAVAFQRRVFALAHRRSVVAATSGRFIAIRRGLFGDFHPDDVRWQDLKDVKLDVGIFGADLTIVAFNTPDLAVSGSAEARRYSGLRKEDAQRVYRLCQSNEQAWRERRRLRELEELRAKSGGIQLGDSHTSADAQAANDPATRLQQAKEMFDKGLLKDSEYEALKSKIISSI
jgi:hypothetical protein